MTRAAGWSVALLGLLAVSAEAASIKSIMREMRGTIREASALSQGAFDAAQARKLFETLASEGEASAQVAGPSSRARFATFVADARKDSASVQTAPQFRSALASLVGQCRSCHDSTR